jgi:hypothetical protein
MKQTNNHPHPVNVCQYVDRKLLRLQRAGNKNIIRVDGRELTPEQFEKFYPPIELQTWSQSTKGNNKDGTRI